MARKIDYTNNSRDNSSAEPKDWFST